jgi:transcriptional regulator with XRE-family HTH domain
MIAARKTTIFILKSTNMILAIGILSVDWSVVAVDFGQRLKELRVQAGMTQLQLAQRMGVTKSVVSFYELQERTPSPDILVKLSGIFKVSTDYLLGLDPRETIDISGLSREDIAIMRALAESLRRKSLYNHGE